MNSICKTLLLVLLLPFLAETAEASHVSGAEISYAAIPGSPNEYVVTLRTYRDCFGIPPAGNVNVNYHSASGCGAAGFVPLTLVSGTGIGNEIQTGVFPPCSASTCVGGTGYGIEEWVYTATLVLPNSCTDWILDFTDCCRSSILTTGADGYALYVATDLDNLNFLYDNSPVPNHAPVFTICVGRTFQLDMSATDPDGDSLVYIMADAWETAGVPVGYDPPYSGSYPIASVPAGSLDAQTGILTVTPVLAQAGAFAVWIESYDPTTGLLISTVRRDGIINVETVCNEPPRFDSLHAVIDSAICSDSILHIKLSWPFRCNTLSNDATDFRILYPAGFPALLRAAIAHNCNALGLSDSITLFLRTPLYMNGVYKIFTKIGYDGNTLWNQCGLAVPSYDTCYFSISHCWVGIDEYDRPQSLLTVYPNPADNFLIIKTALIGNKRFRIMNAAGLLIRTFDSANTEARVDLAGLAGGSYYLEMISERGSERAFFVVIH